jgi:carboxyl-terminal processing protease
VVPVVRDQVELVIIEARMLEDDIAYLRLREFNAVSAKRVREELATLLAQNPKGLVLDLRNNPGGYLNMSVEIASEFLPRGTLVLTERLRDADDKEFRVTRRGQALEIPLVVLVNGGSASASEIVAGAIQANGRGTLIGQPTYGKGSVQNTHSLSDGSSLRVTVAEWLLPDGSHLDGEGLTPDIEIEPSEPTAGQQADDVQLQRAAEYLLEGK